MIVHMGYSSDSERPAKRIKRSQPYQRLSPDLTSGLAPDFVVPPHMPPDPTHDSSPTILHQSSIASPGDQSLGWQENSPLASTPSQLFSPLSTAIITHDRFLSSALTAPPLSGGELPAPTVSPSLPSQSAPYPASADADPLSPASESLPVQRRRKSSSSTALSHYHKPLLVSPFADCKDSFGKFAPNPGFKVPEGGAVNGYLKFRWGKTTNQSSSSNSQHDTASTNAVSWVATPDALAGLPNAGQMSNVPGVPLHAQISVDFSTGTTPQGPPVLEEWAHAFPLNALSTVTSVGQPVENMAVTQRPSNPRMVPPQFGYQAKIEDKTDRRFWEFYIRNWCPGRSVLKDTNLWLTDFAKLQQVPSIRAAIQSLAGVYIYDYMPQPVVSKRVNVLFNIAESRLAELLNNEFTLTRKEVEELITISVILSMQDVVLVERRRKKPNVPRWLQGFKDGERVLERTDPGARFWSPTKVQLTSLHISQSIIVGRAVILSQPMLPLESPETFEPKKESERFGWLLYGNRDEMTQIHGGCGFSKKLLHTMSQISYCAARIQQDGESPIAPFTAQCLLDELINMRQWSRELDDKTHATSDSDPPVIEWVRGLPEDYEIDTPEVMTDVTAEAWRFAALIYLQCRALRLPRNHVEVMANLTDLARCIHIMPTSGSHFTAQAPLFPVFLLGLVSTDPNHRGVSRRWFEQVVQTPVRSSVPPLFEALKRAWQRIDKEIPPSSQNPAEFISERDPWWETLVDIVQQNEEETLCLT